MEWKRNGGKKNSDKNHETWSGSHLEPALGKNTQLEIEDCKSNGKGCVKQEKRIRNGSTPAKARQSRREMAYDAVIVKNK